jgi:hypothetical protein
MKMNAEKDGETRSFQLFFVNRIDSIIYLNIHLLGIELIRIVATPEKVTFVNKLSYEYYQGDYRFFRAFAGINITFDMLQSLFNAVDFSTYDRNFIIDDVETEVHLFSESRCDTTSGMRPTCFSQRVILNNRLLPVRNLIDVPGEGKSLYMNYDQYDQTLEFPFFSTMTIEIPMERIRIFGEVKSPRFNTPGPTGVKIPPKFTPIELNIIEMEREYDRE